MASKEFYESPRWRLLRYSILERDKFTCLACNRTKAAGVILHVDHIKPISLFPELAMTPSNLQTLCVDCNLGKSNLYETNHREEIDRARKEEADKARVGVQEREKEIETAILNGPDEAEKDRFLDKKCSRLWARFAVRIKDALKDAETSRNAKLHAMLTKEYLNAQRRVQSVPCSREFPPGLDHHGNPVEVSQGVPHTDAARAAGRSGLSTSTIDSRKQNGRKNSRKG